MTFPHAKNTQKFLNFGSFRDVVFDRIQNKFKIKLTKMDSIISRIHEQYPDIDRAVISSIVLCFFDILRTELLKGSVINLSGAFPNMGMVWHQTTAENFAIRVKISTPQVLRDSEDEPES